MLTISHNYFNILPSNKSAKDAGQVYSKRRYAFGLFLLVLVDILWVVSSELTKYIYTDLKLERPFLVTYLRSSMLFLYLVVLCFTPPTKDPCRPVDYTQLVEPTTEADEDNFYNEANNSLGDSTFVPVRAGETTDSDDAAPRAVRFNKVAEVRVMSAAQAGEALLARLSWAASVRATEHAQRRAAAAATRRHLRLAAMFAVPWFVSNYLYRLSLLHAPASVATLYAATASAFALALGAASAQAAPDRLTALKCGAVLMTCGGLVIMCGLDGKHYDWAAAAAGVGAALCYAVHLVALRTELRKSEGVNLPLLAGLVGCAVLSAAWAGGAALGALGAEPWALPPPGALGWLLLDAAAGPLLEALWLWGYSLTSAQAATSALTLVIPLPLLLDSWRGSGDYVHTAAGLLVAGGWLAGAAGGGGGGGGGAALGWLGGRLRARQGFSALRSIQDLDEQSESLISSDEPT